MPCKYDFILNPDKLILEDMDEKFVEDLDGFGRWVGVPLFIHVGVADFHIPGVSISDGLSALSEYMFAKSEFQGIGAYPFWNNPGFHLDRREVPVQWFRDRDGKYIYYSDWDDFTDRLWGFSQVQSLGSC